jgi:uncharacterized membrane protein
MNKNILWIAIFGVVVLLGIADLAYHYPRLPDKVASHFDGAGNPNGWTSRAGLLQSFVLVTFLIALSFPGVLWLLPIIPRGMINFPHKEYWLAPERVAQTQSRIGAYLMAMGTLTMAFLALTMHAVMQVNIQPPPPKLPDYTWVSLIFYITFMLGICAAMYFAFKKPPED